MKYIEQGRIVELTARNVTALLAKLDDPFSARTLVSPDGQMMVRSVADESARGGENATESVGSEGVVMLTREELWHLTTPGATVMAAGYRVLSVPDEAHYGDRAPGEVYIPKSGESW